MFSMRGQDQTDDSGVKERTLAAMASSTRVGMFASLKAAATSRRIGAVTLQSFSSGLPLGLVWIALPAFLTYRGVDIKTVGLFSLAQAPWTFKFLWSPLMDRWGPRFGAIGRRRSWILVCQVFLMAAILALAAFGGSADVAIVAFIAILIAFGSASQDIVIDAYAVEVLERSEQGVAVGARTALARTAVLISGAISITLGQRLGWPPVFVGLALLFVPMAAIVFWSPEPAVAPPPPRTVREAVFEPLLDLFRRAGILPILGFLLFYKFGENLATALVRPFLIQKCYVPEDVGLATATIGLTCLITGTIVGGASTERFGLTRCLWIFGAMQDIGFLGLVAVDRLTPLSPCAGGLLNVVVQPMSHRLVMYGAIAAENLCQGLATGAFGVLLLRMTQRKFSATQYALFSSIFALGRTIVGPIAGYSADAVGWTPFFFLCTVASVPGLVLLQRFAPLGGREPELDSLERIEARPISRGRLVATSVAAGLGGFAVALSFSALLSALKAARLHPGAALDYAAALRGILSPVQVSDWVRLAAFLVVGLVSGLAAGAFLAARHGLRGSRLN
jgi:PAT family beta-lactamase induction signal transducer AmpG